MSSCARYRGILEEERNAVSVQKEIWQSIQGERTDAQVHASENSESIATGLDGTIQNSLDLAYLTCELWREQVLEAYEWSWGEEGAHQHLAAELELITRDIIFSPSRREKWAKWVRRVQAKDRKTAEAEMSVDETSHRLAQFG